MIIKILGGTDKVVGEETGACARIVSAKFRVVNEHNEQLVFSSAFARADIRSILLDRLKSLDIPSHISVDVKQGNRSSQPKHQRTIKVEFTAYASSKQRLDSSAKVWFQLPFNMPTLIQYIRKCAEDSANMETLNVRSKTINRQSQWRIQGLSRSEGRSKAKRSVQVQRQRGTLFQW
tara:strand:+ start:1142 stop:1672 length:531 start_codon:yes stop_codon:yes gene_type:complete